MITSAKVRRCDLTGLTLIRAAGEISFRVAKDRYGALSVRKNSIVGPLPIGTVPGGNSRGRYDSIGSTVYLADSRHCAYAEVLLGFRQQRAAVAKAAESIGWTVEDYITSVRAQAEENGVDVPWAISVDWQMDRSMYEIRLPGQGWWVQIDDAATLRALEVLTPTTAGLTERLQLLTAGSLTGDDRDLTTLLSHVIRGTVLDDGLRTTGDQLPVKNTDWKVLGLLGPAG